jgi:predicted RNA-binding Zn ribbon-like protein
VDTPRAGSWPLVGGHPVLDLADTLAWRLAPGREADRLAVPELLAPWAVAAGVVTAQEARAWAADGSSDEGGTAAALRRVHDLRAVAVRVLDAHVERRPQAPADLEGLRRVALAAWRRAEPAGLPLRWVVPADGRRAVADRLALATVDLLSTGDLSRIRRCEGEGCGWFFLDATRSRTRRWCASSDCGNRARVRRHQARRRERTGETPPAVPSGTGAADLSGGR